MNGAYEEGSSADENSELEHQSQRKFSDQVAFVNPAIALKEQVKRVCNEGSSEDERTESYLCTP